MNIVISAGVKNYEYRLRYDEASKFFKREMELKRKYKEGTSVSAFKPNSLFKERNDNQSSNIEYELKQNGWFRRDLFSLTGLYYRLFGYGEDLKRIAFVSIGFLEYSLQHIGSGSILFQLTHIHLYMLL
jgi:hypothetical protein